MKLKINGLKELLREIDRIDREAPKEVELELKKIADIILNDAKSRVHVITGELKASAFVEKIEGGWVIGFSALYAPYEEFGTGPLTQVPQGYESYAKEFYVSGKGHSPAHPFLFPAFLSKRESMVTDLEVSLREYLKQF